MKLEKVTIDEILSWNPCGEYTRERLKKLFGRKRKVDAVQIAQFDISDADKLWAILYLATENMVHLWVCDVVERSLLLFETEYPDDKRLREAIETKRRWDSGEATDEAMDAARDVARNIARDVPGGIVSQTWRVAWSAVLSVVFVDRDTAWHNEKKWQLERLLEYINEETA